MSADENHYGDYASGIRVERTLAYLESIPDPYDRIKECGVASDQARAIQGKIAAVRRRAVYEATLRPGASGESVAAELGVSPKAVSAAISEFRKADLELFRSALSLYGRSATTVLPQAEIDAARSSRDVLFAAKTVLKAHVGRVLGAENDDAFSTLEDSAERARALAQAGRLEVPSSAWDRKPIGQTEPDYARVPPAYRYLARVLNALPQILVSIWENQSDNQWMLSWAIRPAEPYSTVFDAGPHRDGWATTEWLVWFLRDYVRAGYDIDQYVTSPPPFLNEPGESMSFVALFARGGELKEVDPDEFASSIMSTWDTTGYAPVDWPATEEL
jgi:transposase-like protein